MPLFGGVVQRPPPGDHGVEHDTGDGPLVGEWDGVHETAGRDDGHGGGVVLEAGVGGRYVFGDEGGEPLAGELGGGVGHHVVGLGGEADDDLTGPPVPAE